MISSVDAVMGFSEAVLESLFSEFPEAQAKRRFVIPHGNYCQDYPPPLPKSQARLELGLPEDAFVILFFGGLRSNKGVVELIQSFEKLENSKNSLVIAGGGETPDVSAALDRASANPRIKLYRRVIPDAEVPTFFGAADVVAFPFRSILNSGSVILALSMARCVVVPGVPSLVEQIPDFACFQFPPCDSGGLVSALGEALATPDLSDRGQQARAQMLNDRDWNTIGEKAVQMYQQLLA
jgi:glycosyltransferase involved in cell wall biosynthesis